MRYLVLGLIGLGGGFFISAGLFAVMVTVRIINRFAHMTNTGDYILLYEEMIILGSILGNISYIYGWSFKLGECAGCIFWAFAGLFSGAFIISIAEVIKAVPIFVRRARISTGLGIIIILIAVGKVLGALMHSFM